MGCSLVLLPTAKLNPRAMSVPHASKTFHPAVHEMSARDDLRLRRRSRSAALAAAGALLIVASLVIWPRGVCGLVASPTVESGILTLAGIVLLSAEIVALVIGSRRFRHHATARHFSRGKPDPGFVNPPDMQLPSGLGSGGPLNHNLAQLANPTKTLPGRH